MSTLELKKELYKYIDQGDKKLVRYIYEKIKAYQAQLEADKMIAEGEEDIEAGRVYSIDEAKKMLKDWKE